MLNLLLIGRASPNVFNGTLLYDEDGIPLEQPQTGVLARNDVGYLYWNREQRSKLPKVYWSSTLSTAVTRYLKAVVQPFLSRVNLA